MTEAFFKTATMPVGAPVEPIKAPVEPIQAPVAPTKAPTESIKTSAKSTSRKASASFSKFLDTNFRRKLSFILPEISCYFGRLGNS